MPTAKKIRNMLFNYEGKKERITVS